MTGVQTCALPISYGPLSDESGRKEYRVEALSAARGAVLARIEGVADRTAAEAIRGLRLYVERKRLPEAGERQWYEADLIHASRKKRIARGSGVQVQDVNKLLKQHADMLKMMKRVNKLGEKGFMRSLGGMTPPPGFPR